uniref:Uncharacterized protein n=1 Tax=Romanomermis culicivorax TaxID=13658 RepID=A0A915K9J3_ROMCU
MDQGDRTNPQTKQTRKIKSCMSTNFKEAVMFLVAKDLSLLDSTSLTLTVCDNRSKNAIGSLVIGKNSKYKHLIDLWCNVLLQKGKTFKVSHTLDSIFGCENEGKEERL